MPTAETTLFPAYSANQRANQTKIVDRLRLDDEPKIFNDISVDFIDENGGGPGVRLRKLSQGKQRK
jgi:hypothetical protein